MARGKPDKRSHSKFQTVAPMRDPDPTLDPVVEPLVDVIDPEPRSDLDLVTVRNHGALRWVGSDYAASDGHLPPEGTGRITERLARELINRFGPEGLGGVGPLEIVEG